MLFLTALSLYHRVYGQRRCVLALGLLAPRNLCGFVHTPRVPHHTGDLRVSALPERSFTENVERNQSPQATFGGIRRSEEK